MSKTIHQKMHEQHSEWQSDLQTWQADIELWKKELQAAVNDIATIDAALRDSLTALESHADTVWEHQQRIKAHEGVIGQESREGANKTDKAWAATHDAESSRHRQVADAHARIKDHQHAVVTEVRRLMNRIMEAI